MDGTGDSPKIASNQHHQKESNERRQKDDTEYRQKDGTEYRQKDGNEHRQKDDIDRRQKDGNERRIKRRRRVSPKGRQRPSPKVRQRPSPKRTARCVTQKDGRRPDSIPAPPAGRGNVDKIHDRANGPATYDQSCPYCDPFPGCRVGFVENVAGPLALTFLLALITQPYSRFRGIRAGLAYCPTFGRFNAGMESGRWPLGLVSSPAFSRDGLVESPPLRMVVTVRP